MSSILDKNCGQSVCRKTGNKAAWKECPKPATETKMIEVIRKENENVREVIKKENKNLTEVIKKENENLKEVVKKENENLKEVIEEKIEEVTKLQDVMENQLRKILEKISQDCGRRY